MTRDVALVLAAGKGTRMRSSLPKVLHPLAGKPMIVRVLDSLERAGFASPYVLVGYGADRVEQVVGARCQYLRQEELLGTGHAARVALDSIPAEAERLLLIHGDEPLIPDSVYRQMLDLQGASGATVVLLTTNVRDTRGFGRVVRDERGRPVALLQESDLSPEQRELDEVNLGVYVFDIAFLRRELPRLRPHVPKDELYLTDVVAAAAEAGKKVEAVTIEGGEDVMGINDLIQLEAATTAFYRAIAHRHLAHGVNIVSAASTFIDEDVVIAADTLIHPCTIIQGPTRIGAGCEIGPGTRILASVIGERCRVIDSTIESSIVEDDVVIGPYAHLRPGARIGAGASIGNYAEVKNSFLGPGARLNHFSYLGDATVGRNVNIGAGTITCNFDGQVKQPTVIEDDAFIGSDTMLRAPITIGRGAYTGAGSVVTRDVPPGAMVAGVPARELRRKVTATNRDPVKPDRQDGKAT